jgi:hypothetical protein
MRAGSCHPRSGGVELREPVPRIGAWWRARALVELASGAAAATSPWSSLRHRLDQRMTRRF